MNKHFDVIVVGGGHSGIEAALASSRMGAQTALFVMKIESIGMMSCNPALGGPAKGHLAREIDALGGEMGIAGDTSGIHFRMLNQKKGPAVWSPRSQNDRYAYSKYMREVIENQKGLSVIESQIVDLYTEYQNGSSFSQKDTVSFVASPQIESIFKVKGVVSLIGKEYFAPKVILANGTFMNGTIFVGNQKYSGGRSGEPADNFLSQNLLSYGIQMRRFKTGTPPRVDIESVLFSHLETQHGDENPLGFSHFREVLLQNKVSCFITHTTAETHKLIKDNLLNSAMYGGHIIGTGARYCPSIEDKIVKFSDKEQHHIFIEPEGLNTREAYVNGLSNSLPPDVQDKMIATIPALAKAKVMRYGYAIEYDCIFPEELYPTLESKRINGLYFAGQINGTSGYEEAAAQGIVSGINAVLSLSKEDTTVPFTRESIAAETQIIFDRANSYIGVLIDDLVTKGTNEPYRLFTSRAEYRLFLRQDNAADRLMPLGFKLGLIPNVRWQMFLEQQNIINREIEKLKNQSSTQQENLSQPLKLINLIKRPEIDYTDLANFGYQIPNDVNQEIINKINILIKYEGYLKRQKEEIVRFANIESMKIPETLVFSDLEGISIEAREKMNYIKPKSIGQASRISGVNFTDIQALMIHIKKHII